MIKIKTYEEFETFIKTWAEGKINYLLIESAGGLSKTYTAQEKLERRDYVYVTSHITPLRLYKLLWENKHKDFVFDDIDRLLENKTIISILKGLTDTRKEKVIQYHSTSEVASDVPEEFMTTSKVLMLANDIKTMSKNHQALLTRGHHLSFEPVHSEILSRLKEFASDEEVYGMTKDEEENNKRYWQSDKYKQYQKRYNQSDKRRQAQKRYYEAHKVEILLKQKKRRGGK